MAGIAWRGRSYMVEIVSGSPLFNLVNNSSYFKVIVPNKIYLKLRTELYTTR